MFTVIGLFKRRPGMSMEDFQKHYEGTHAPLGAKYMAGIIDYKRRYLTPVPYPLDGTTYEAEYDVITEMSFPDKASAEACYAALTSGEGFEVLSRDEENFFDKSKNRLMYVSDCSSKL